MASGSTSFKQKLGRRLLGVGYRALRRRLSFSRKQAKIFVVLVLIAGSFVTVITPWIAPAIASRPPKPALMSSGFKLFYTEPYCNERVYPAPAVPLHWDKPNGAVKFDLYRNGTLYLANIIGVGAPTSFTNEVGLVPGETYAFFVRATDAHNRTVDSETIQVFIPDVCGCVGGKDG